MRNYVALFLLIPQVIKRLGKGAQGSVFLVEENATKEKCVLKKVNNFTIRLFLISKMSQ